MMLKLFQSDKTRRVSAEELANYHTFARKHQTDEPSKELELFERFYAARALLEQGLDVFLDPTIGETGATPTVSVDTCGVQGESLTMILCETSGIDPSLMPTLKLVSASSNARAVILAPTPFDTSDIEDAMPDALATGKISVEHLGWFDDHFDQTLQETLRLIDLLGNETRMRMLAPLFRRTSDKREYRTTINPKLVYKNLEVLLEARLVNENETGYELSGFGKNILAEFITFLEKTRKTLASIPTREEEVKNE